MLKTAAFAMLAILAGLCAICTAQATQVPTQSDYINNILDECLHGQFYCALDVAAPDYTGRVVITVAGLDRFLTRAWGDDHTTNRERIRSILLRGDTLQTSVPIFENSLYGFHRVSPNSPIDSLERNKAAWEYCTECIGTVRFGTTDAAVYAHCINQLFEWRIYVSDRYITTDTALIERLKERS